MKSTHTMSLEVMSGMMPLTLRFKQLVLRLFVRCSILNPLVIEKFKALAEEESKCKLLDVFHDFSSLQVELSTLTIYHYPTILFLVQTPR